MSHCWNFERLHILPHDLTRLLLQLMKEFFSLSRSSWRCRYKSQSNAFGWTGVTAKFKSCSASSPAKLQNDTTPRGSVPGELKGFFLVRKSKLKPEKIIVPVLLSCLTPQNWCIWSDSFSWEAAVKVHVCSKGDCVSFDKSLQYPFFKAQTFFFIFSALPHSFTGLTESCTTFTEALPCFRGTVLQMQDNTLDIWLRKWQQRFDLMSCHHSAFQELHFSW